MRYADLPSVAFIAATTNGYDASDEDLYSKQYFECMEKSGRVNCSFYNKREGGTVAQWMASSCGLEETAKRADELDRMTFQD
jgi:hypothetical protein